jgi:plastocyanin
MNKKYLLSGLLLLIVIIAGTIIWNGSIGNSSKGTTRSSESPRAPLPKEVTVTLDKNGFSPKEVTIKVGSAVRWKNVSGAKQTVNSDNYPTNQLHKELNFGLFNNNATVVYIFKKPGTYGYHNQLHPEQKGKIVVEE